MKLTMKKLLKFLCLLQSQLLVLTRATGEVATTTLFVGDSDIEGWSTDSTFPNSANVGVGGYTCTNVYEKLSSYISKYPSTEWIVLVCGENDLWYQSVDKTFSKFVAIVNEFISNGNRVLYVGTKPEPDTKSLHDEYRKYDEKIRNKAIELAVGSELPPLVMVDVYPIFDVMEIEDPGALYQNDDLHLNEYGYSFWTKWTKTALSSEEETCILWKDNECDKFNGSISPTVTPYPTQSASPSVAEPGPSSGVNHDWKSARVAVVMTIMILGFRNY